MTTKTNALLKAFENGEELTSAQIRSRYGIANVTATIHNLRANLGYSIYLNERKNYKGEKVNKYRLGTPSRKVLAAGYRALAAGM
mgnify:CR=1 FL=1